MSAQHPGEVVTFYSYKGGTGRSMLLANLAWLLAANQKKVLVIDWDLEAPGLHRYFRPFLVDPELTETPGLIDAVWSLITRVMSQESTAPRTLDPTHLNLAGFDFEDFITPLDWKFEVPGGIDFIGAGRQGGTYSERVNTFDWKYFYEIGGGRLLDHWKADIVARYDYVLIDSRTGVSDTSGICTAQLPDSLVACLTLNRQSIDGVAAVLESVRAWQKKAIQTNQPRIGLRRKQAEIYPIATRIENSEKERLDSARRRVRSVFQAFLNMSTSAEERAYWDDMEVTYRPFYAYEEILAGFGDPAGAAGSANTLLSEVERIGRRLFDMPRLAMPQITEPDRQSALGKYSFGPMSGKEPTTALEESYPGSSDVEFQRSIYAKEVRWRNGGFRYRDLLSRREVQLIKAEERASFSREMAFFYTNSELVPAFRDKTFYAFALFWGGAFLLSLWTSFSWIKLSPYSLVEFRNSEVTVLAFLGYMAIMVFSLLAAYRSSLKPFGTSLSDIVRLCILGPLARDIEDYGATRT
jgi:cellulose biosynthesis protein BcsQ